MPSESQPSDASQFGALAPFYDELMRVVPYDQWAEYVQTLFAFSNHEPRRVLDCACGTGNVSFELAKAGLNVTGVDLSAPMIEVAQRKMQHSELAPRLHFFQADLTNFDLGETFDSATCLYDSLNYILDPAQLHAAFGRIAAHMEPEGVFVFDMNSVYALTADLFTQKQLDPRHNLHYDWQAKFDESTQICTVDMRFMRKGADGEMENFYETHRERAYPLDQVQAMLHDTGWDLIHTFDAYTLNRPHDRSERWYFVAQKI